MNILITSGGTREPIDGVRFISNFSTGNTGAFLTDYFRQQGHHVTLIRGKDSRVAKSDGPSFEYMTFNDLDLLLKKTLAKEAYDVVIHAAAVSDYSIKDIEINDEKMETYFEQKISSESEALTLRLKRNPKLIHKLRDYAVKKDFILIGFKLTHTQLSSDRLNSVQKLASNENVDFIVHNDLSQISENGTHVANIYKNLKSTLHSNKSLAQNVNSNVREENLGPHIHFTMQVYTKIELAEGISRLLKEHA